MLIAGKDIAVAKAVLNGEECVLRYPGADDYFNESLRARDEDETMGFDRFVLNVS